MGLIKDFQTKHGLLPDGQIGKKTLLKIKEVLSIPTIEALSHFMGQCDHESAEFTRLEENLNYSEQALLNIFKHDFDTNKDRVLSPPERKRAKELARKPEKIANFIYANQNGNGDEASGDGWKHRGFGPLQLTGKANQDDFAKIVNDPFIIDNPSLIATKYAFESAKYYFDSRNLWSLCRKVDTSSIIKVSKVINLGNVYSKGTPIGLEERIAKTNHYYKILTT